MGLGRHTCPKRAWANVCGRRTGTLTNDTNSSAHNSTRARRAESARGNIKERLRRAGPVDPGIVDRWSNYYTGDDVLHQADMGIVIGKAANNHDNLQLLAFVQSVVHAANFSSMSALIAATGKWNIIIIKLY